MQKHTDNGTPTFTPASGMSRAIALLTLVAYIGQPLAAYAQVIAAPTAAPANRPIIDAAANGLPLVQITTPSAAGVSRNQYTSYNVGPGGVILNNSATNVLTQQAGYVTGNPNLAGGPARIILNEVTSANPSLLNGYTEVAGSRADVIIANPNGITCNGCGFINAGRGVLTTGTPVFGGTGSLDAFRVTGGQINIGTGGLNAANTSQLDLIARSVQVNGALWAGNLNVITGANQVNYANLGVQIIAGSGNKPTVAIDLAQLGGMYANKILLVGTEAGVGVNSLGHLAAQAGDFTLSSQGQITLVGSTTASGNINITSNTGITNSGALYSQQTAQLASAGSITNSGLIGAQGNVSLGAASLSSTGTLAAGINAGGAATQSGNLNISTQAQTAATGTNMAGGTMTVAATDISLANSRTTALGGMNLGASAGNINLAGALTQSAGSVLLNATGTVDNTAGILYGAGNLSIASAGNLVNTGGQIGSGQDLSITAATIAGIGQAIAGRDANISLQGSYTNAAGNVLKANRNLTLNTTGAFVNQTALASVGALTVNAASIDNQAAAGITSASTLLKATVDITNAGSIYGATLETHSNNFTNTGTVMGNTINLYANNLNNQGATAHIAAAQSANLILTNALNNLDGATIFSLGDVNIGSNLTLDANGYLTGSMASVTNSSATIEAWGNLRIAANNITNTRTVLGFTWGPSTPGPSATGTVAYNGAGGSPTYTSTYQTQQFTAATTPAGQLLANNGMWFSGGAPAATLTNNYSTIIAGTAVHAQTGINNVGTFITQQTLSGTIPNYNWGITGTVSCGFFSSCYTYGWIWSPIPYSAVVQTTSPISGVTYQPNTGTKQAATGPAPVAQAVAGSTAGSVPAGGAVTVPSGGVYTLQTQPRQPYLVATDPRFTNYQTFLSSDYMLSHLSIDPIAVEKRLGDGFYEQKLVLDQIAGQTGRRFLGNYSSANDQYLALMNAGVSAAKELKLVPGIALTAKQIASLASDIVWLVDEVAVLPDGKSQHVLVPKVYLTRMNFGDIKPSGALIAADAIDFKTSGAANNSGTIKAGSQLSIRAQDIVNTGGTLASKGATLMNAANDIRNQSGSISGHRVALVAGRDIVSETTTETVTMGNVTSTLVKGVAGITATDTLDVTAGRDVTLAASNIKSGGDASISAGRDLTVSTVATQQTATNGVTSASSTKQLTSSIQTGGNLSLGSGNNMKLISALLDAGGNATLAAGGDLTLAASKNTVTTGYITDFAQAGAYDETVLGSTLKAGGNITLAATTGAQTSDKEKTKGNVALESAFVTSKSGNIAIVADGNVDIGTASEKHTSYSEVMTESKSDLTTTQRTERTDTSRTDAKGSSLSGDKVTIFSKKDIGITGSDVSANNNIDIVAMGNVNISAATNTSSSEHYSHEHTSGLQAGDGLSPTDSGPETTAKSRTDSTSQSFSRSHLSSKNGNLSIVAAGGNLLASGTDLAAKSGDLSLTAAGTVALLAGQDTLTKDSSIVTVTNPNVVTKQRKTITDAYNSIDNQGSTAQGMSVKVSSGYDIILQGAQFNAGKGGIDLNAGHDIQLLAAMNGTFGSHHETLSTDGMNADPTNDRRKDNKAEFQNQTAQVTSLVSQGNITTHSGRDTRIEASNLDAQGAIDISAGTAATYSADGTVKDKEVVGNITFAAVKDTTYNAVTDSHSSATWQGQSGHGDYKENVRLANINAGKGLSVNANGSITVETPEVAAEAAPPAPPAPAPRTVTTCHHGHCTTHTVTPPAQDKPKLTPEEQAHADAEKKAQDQKRFDDHIQNLAKQPGQAWIAKLAKDPKTKVQWQKVHAAAQHWEYSHEGLTPEMAAVIAIAVTAMTSGVAGSAASALTQDVIAQAALTAGFTTLASQASVALINNKGDIGKTLNDMGQSSNVRALAAAMATAGALRGLNDALGFPPDMNPKTASFNQLLAKNVIDNVASATISHAINGGDLKQQLEQSLKTAFIDTSAAKGANWIGDMWQKDKINDFTHKLTHALAGCAAGEAKAHDCSSGALGAVVGEIAAEAFAPNDGTLTAQQKTNAINFAKTMAGVAAALTGGDVNLAAAAGANAAENNALLHPKEIEWIKKHAKEYAAQHQNMSVEEATTILARQAARSRDASAATWLGAEPNQDAQKFLNQAEGTYLNEKGQPQALFSNLSGDYMNVLTNAYEIAKDQSAKNFYFTYIAPATAHSDTWPGVGQLVKVKAGELPGDVARGLGNMSADFQENPWHATAPYLLYQMGSGLVDSLGSAGNSVGAGFVLLTDQTSQDLINSLYGRSDAYLVGAAYAFVPGAAMVGTALVGGPGMRAAGNTFKDVKATIAARSAAAAPVVAKVAPAAAAAAPEVAAAAAPEVAAAAAPEVAAAAAPEAAAAAPEAAAAAPQAGAAPVTSGGTANAATAVRLKNDLALAQSQDPLIGTTLPGAKSPVTVTAESNIGGQTLVDTNQTARPVSAADPNKPTLISSTVPPGEPNASMATAHAEVGVIQQAYDAGLTKGQPMTIVVRGQSVCSYCQGDLMLMADKAGLSSLTVVDGSTGSVVQWIRGSNVWKPIQTPILKK